MIKAIFHCQIRIISRADGKSAVASAAYRAGQKLIDEYYGTTQDYSKKKGVVFTEIMLPQNAPPEYKDRQTLWNAVEQIEKAKNSQLAREIEIALSIELSQMAKINLAKEYVYRNFVTKGMVADLCFHDTGEGNPHCHIMLTMRPFNDDKTWGAKQKKVYALDENGNKIYDQKKRQYKCKSVPSTDWNERTKAEEWRSAWAELCNEYLSASGLETKVDHRSFERQGIEQKPTIHMGAAVTQLERKGVRTEIGDLNRQIKLDNSMLQNLKQKIAQLEKLAEKSNSECEENLIEKLIRFNDNGNKFNEHIPLNLKNYKNAKSLQDVSKSIVFLQQNNITTIAELNDKIVSHKHKANEVIIAFNEGNKRYNQLCEKYNNSKNKSKSLRKELDDLSLSIKKDKVTMNNFINDIDRMQTILLNVKTLDNYEQKQHTINIAKSKSYELSI